MFRYSDENLTGEEVQEMHVDASGGGQRVDQHWVIELIGEHDLSTAPMIAEWMAGIDDSAQLIEIDLRRGRVHRFNRRWKTGQP